MRKIILIWLFTIFIASLLFSNGNYETVATINIGNGPDEFLIKHVAECREYPIKTYITPNNEFCILFPNNDLIRKYSPDFSSYEEIPVSDSLIKKYSNSGDVEFIEAFMVEEDNDVWYYFWSSNPIGSTIIHQLPDESIEIFHIGIAAINQPRFIIYKNLEYLYGHWHYNQKYYSTSVCLNDLSKSDDFWELVDLREDSIFYGIDVSISKNGTKVAQSGNTVVLSGRKKETIYLNLEGPVQDDSDYFISTLPQLDRDGNILCLIKQGKTIHIMKRILM